MKKILITLVITCSILSVSAQNFFSRMPRDSNKSTPSLFSSRTSGPLFGVTEWTFRPIVSITSYSVPGNQLSTGAGVAYEWLSQDPTTQLWTSTISLSLLVNYNLPLTPESKPGSPIGVSSFIGLFNNHFLLGGMYDGKKLNFEVGTAINFNN